MSENLDIDLVLSKADFTAAFGENDPAFVLVIEHLKLVLAANLQTNLTSVTDPFVALYRQTYDSLMALPIFTKLPTGRFVDMGSGAGYPGIPLAIYSGWPGLLIESIQKKARLLTEFVQILGLKDSVQIVAERSESLAENHLEGWDIVCCRAVSSLPAILELASPLLKIGGYLIAYKGQDVQQELQMAKSLKSLLGLEFLEIEEYQIPHLELQHTLIIFQKVAPATIHLPRRPGRAQRHPF